MKAVSLTALVAMGLLTIAPTMAQAGAGGSDAVFASACQIAEVRLQDQHILFRDKQITVGGVGTVTIKGQHLVLGGYVCV